MEIIQLLVDSFWPMFKAGLLISVPLMLVSFVVGLVLAFVLALMRMSKIAPFKAIAWFVVWVIRGTPCPLRRRSSTAASRRGDTPSPW